MKLNKKITSALLVLCLVSMMVYFIVRGLGLFSPGYTVGERALAFMLAAGECFILVHGLGYVLNIVRVVNKCKPPKVSPLAGKEPSVAILVAARHEPKEVLDDTFVSLVNLRYTNKQIYFLDDSSDAKYQREADELAETYGLTIFRRVIRHGAKAGIVNDCLKVVTQDYVAIFDADQCPLPSFLELVVPILEADKKLAFVQTPQFYSNILSSPIARAAGFQQSVFYEYICEGKSCVDSMFCCGTNVVFRKEALQEVGGLDESTVTEDFATSVKLHGKGWRSYYYNHTYTFGIGPEDLVSFFKQQFRWAAGTIGVARMLLKRLFRDPFSLSFVQWWEYLLSSTYYFTGIAFLFLAICPIVFIFWNFPSFFLRPQVYFLAFLPYIVFTMSVFYFVLENRNYRMKDLFLGQLLGMCTFSVYIRGAVSAVLGIKVKFGVSGKIKGDRVSYWRLWPQLGMGYLNFAAFIWGINRFAHEGEPAILVSCFWCLYHAVILSSIMYFNEGEQNS